jgi:hypothetical protein
VISVASIDAAAVGGGRSTLFDSDDSKAMFFRQSTGDPADWEAYAGDYLTGASTATGFLVHQILFNGASSSIWINDGDANNGDAGTQNADGITIGTLYRKLSYWDGDIVVPAIIADPALSDADRDSLRSEINSYWSIY